MNPTTVRALTGGAIAVALSSLTACGTIQGLMPGQDPFLDLSPRSIAKAAFSDMVEVRSMRVIGSMESKTDGFTRIDLRLDKTSCSGSLGTEDGTVQIRKNADGAWFSADEAYWRAHRGPLSTAGDARSYTGKWSAIARKDPLLKMCDLDKLLAGFELDGNDTDDTIDAGEVVQIGDADAVPLTGRDGKELTTVWIAVDAPHRVLKVAPTRDTGRPDELYFEEFGAKVEVDAPNKKDVVNLPRR